MPTPHAKPLRISAVSFFNTAPLIYGLDQDPTLVLRFGVPSSLLDDLTEDRADVALLPVIDCQRVDGLRLLPATGIGCEGPTLTVRLFSASPIEQTRVLAVDPDSHTSVVLARVILAKQFGLRPEVVSLREIAADAPVTRLLIGDKVVTHEPKQMPFQLDLGEAWNRMTGLPFVFATWTLRANVDATGLAAKLRAAKSAGMERMDELIQRSAIPRGWPADIARRYLTDYLKFDIGPRQIEAIRRFHALAAELGFIDRLRDVPIEAV